jgi:hypothetical protein
MAYSLPELLSPYWLDAQIPKIALFYFLIPIYLAAKPILPEQLRKTLRPHKM